MNTYQFQVFKIKIDFRSASKTDELRFENRPY